MRDYNKDQEQYPYVIIQIENCPDIHISCIEWELDSSIYGIFYGPSITGPRQDTTHNEIFEVQDRPLRYSELARMGYFSRGTYTWDELSKVGYRSYPGGFSPAGSGINPAGFLSYEDELSIAAKGIYVRQTGLGGTIIWAINYDHMPDGSSPLLGAVKRNFLTAAP